jgi:hypothetical protein
MELIGNPNPVNLHRHDPFWNAITARRWNQPAEHQG